MATLGDLAEELGPDGPGRLWAECPTPGLVWGRSSGRWVLRAVNAAGCGSGWLAPGLALGAGLEEVWPGSPALAAAFEEALTPSQAGAVERVIEAREAEGVPALRVRVLALGTDLVLTWISAGAEVASARGEAAWTLFERGEDAASVWREEGDEFVLIDYNLAAVEASGGGISKLVGRRASELYPGQSAVVEFLRRTAVEGRVVEPELRYRTASTGEAGVHHVLGLRSGAHVFVFTRDRTREHARDESLRVSRAMLEAIMSASPIGLLRLDERGRVEEINRRWALIHAPNELEVGMVWDACVEASRRDEVRRDVAGAMGEARAVRFEYPVAGASSRWVLAELVPIHPHGGASWLMVALDVTELREAREAAAERALRLARAERMESIGRLAGGVAHDFNNVLAAITGLVELAIPDTPAGSQVRGDLEEVLRTARRAAGLARQLLAFAGRQAMRPRAVDLGGAVRALEPMLRRYLGGTIQISIHEDRDVPPVLADPSQVDQVIVNLAVNARDAMPGGGALRLRIERCTRALCEQVAPELRDACRHVALVVEDEGEGIAPEHLPHVFEPFYSTRGKEDGRGLGLASVHGVIEQLQGRIHVESSLGVGTRFHVLWPMADEEGERDPAGDATEASPASLPGEAHASPIVLLVDDDPVVRLAVGRLLSRQGCEVATAEDGLAADAWLERNGPPALLVTDVIMPRLGGAELALRARARWPELPVLFVSAFQHEDAGRVRHFEAPSRLLPKPVAAGELIRAVDELLSVDPTATGAFARRAGSPREG